MMSDLCKARGVQKCTGGRNFVWKSEERDTML